MALLTKTQAIVVMLVCLLLIGATIPPNETAVFDLVKTQIYWTWSQRTGAPAQGFKIYCAPADNLSPPSPTGQTISDVTVVDVPSSTARNYLIGPVISPILAAYGGKAPTYALLLKVVCVVSAYNQAGESADGVVGAPLPVSSTYFQVRN